MTLKTLMISLALFTCSLAADDNNDIQQQWDKGMNQFLTLHGTIRELLIEGEEISPQQCQEYQKSALNFWHDFDQHSQEDTVDQDAIEKFRRQSKILSLGLQDLNEITLYLLRFHAAKDAMMAAVEDPEFEGNKDELTPIIQEIDEYFRGDASQLSSSQQYLLQLINAEK
jgi:hypothetical protein